MRPIPYSPPLSLTKQKSTYKQNRYFKMNTSECRVSDWKFLQHHHAKTSHTKLPQAGLQKHVRKKRHLAPDIGHSEFLYFF